MHIRQLSFPSFKRKPEKTSPISVEEGTQVLTECIHWLKLSMENFPKDNPFNPNYLKGVNTRIKNIDYLCALIKRTDSLLETAIDGREVYLDHPTFKLFNTSTQTVGIQLYQWLTVDGVQRNVSECFMLPTLTRIMVNYGQTLNHVDLDPDLKNYYRQNFVRMFTTWKGLYQQLATIGGNDS